MDEESPAGRLGDGLRVFGAPQRYVQGPGALDDLGPLVARLGAHVVLLLDAGVADLLGDRLGASLAREGLPSRRLVVDLEVTHPNIESLVGRLPASSGGHEVVVGVGGGKTLDLARAVSWRRGSAFVTVPTVASNDSPAAMAVAVYDEHHRMVEVVQTGRNPELVLVDTAVIASAPPRFLSAGIGDAVAKKFEARSCRAVGGTNQHGTRSLLVASAVADACYETLRTSAAAGLEAARRRTVDRALEDTVEATILMSGLAFENGGLSIAHSFVRGLQAVPGTSGALHGEHVAYGLLVQLALEGSDEHELRDLVRFLRSVSLPTTLAELGLGAPTSQELDTMTERCLASPHRHKTPARADHHGIRSAVDRVEALA